MTRHARNLFATLMAAASCPALTTFVSTALAQCHGVTAN